MSVSFLSGLLWWHSDPSHIQDQVLYQPNEQSLILLPHSLANELENMLSAAGWFNLLLLNLLGVLPTVQRHLRIPTGAANAEQRALLWDVPSVLILHG